MSFKIPKYNNKIDDKTLKFRLLFANVCDRYELQPLIDLGLLDEKEQLTEKGKQKLIKLRNN